MKVFSNSFRVQSTKNSTSRFRFSEFNSGHRGSSIDISENRNILHSRSKFSQLQYTQELTKANKELDSFEITESLNKTPKSFHSAYLRFLEAISLILKLKDSPTANCVIRGLIGLKKSASYWPDAQEEQPKQVIKSRSFRENFTQTYEARPKEEFDTINEEILYIKNIFDKTTKFKSGKIIKRLVDLHEDLSKLYTDIPSPTDTPEPAEISLGSIGQKMGLALKLMKSEIRESLSKVQLSKKTVLKSTQTELVGNEENVALLREKEIEIAGLKRFLEHSEQQIQSLSESLCKYKSYSIDIENRYNEQNIEFIQTKNNLQSSADKVKSLKTRLTEVAEKHLKKSQKLQECRKNLNDLKLEIISLTHSVKQAKSENFNLNILSKVAEEKLSQIESSWVQSTGQKFLFEAVSTIDVVRKHKIFLEDTQEEASFSSYSYLKSPAGSPRFNRRLEKNDKKEDRGSFNYIKSLVQKDFKLAKDTERLAQNPIIESFPLRPDSFQLDSDCKNKFNESLPVIKESISKPQDFKEKLKPKSFDNTLKLIQIEDEPEKVPRFHSRKPSKIHTSLLRETQEISSSSGGASPLNRHFPIISALVYEREVIHNKPRAETEKFKNVEENSKSVQCELEKEAKKMIFKSETLRVKQRPDPDAFDEDTVENLKKMCEKVGIQEFDSIPLNVKMEIFKSLEGHDSKRCEVECVHLKRLANLRYKARGVPYPIKTSTLTTRF